MKRLTILGSAIAVSSASLALEAPLKVEGDELGASLQYSMFQSSDDDDTTEDTKIVNLKAETTYQTKQGDWGQAYRLAAINSQNNGGGSVERYNASAKGMRFLQNSDYLFARLAAEKDIQSGYDYDTDLVGGYGRTLIDTERSTLVAEIGAGARYLKSGTPELDDELEPVASLGALFKTQLLEQLSFSQELASTLGTEEQSYESVTAFETKLSDSLAAKLSYEINIDQTDIGDETEQVSLIGVTFKR